MRYATWNLTIDTVNEVFIGPEGAILSQGFDIRPLCSIGSLEDHSVLGVFTGNNENLTAWNFNEISRDTAIQIYSENFIEIEAQPESLRPAFTLEMALAYNFPN